MGKVCKFCNNEVLGNPAVYANHIRWCDKNLTNGDKGIKNNKLSKLQNYESKFGLDKEFKVNCSKCAKTFSVIEPEFKYPKKEKYYCSRSCANTRIHSVETKKILSEKSKTLWTDESYANKVIKNNTNKNRRFTSIGEEEIRNYFQRNYIQDEWTFGGGFKYCDTILTRDLYSNKLKVIVEYDGIWHFKDIHGQLELKRKKDLLLENWVIENGWRLIRIKDELFKKDKKLYLNLLVESIYEKSEQIIKFY